MEYNRIDVDSHLQEKPNLWTSRMSKEKWGDRIPQLREMPDGSERWFVNEQPRSGPAICEGVMPDRETPPKRWDEVPSIIYEAEGRMKAMDQDHVDAQVFYPNITGTTGDAFFGQEPDFEAEACRAYNDYQTEEFINVNPERFCGLTSLPYGLGIARTVEEAKYGKAGGHKGVVMMSAPHQRGLPHFNERYWDPLWETCEELQIPVHFHGSGGAFGMWVEPVPGSTPRRARALRGSAGFNLQAQFFSMMLFSGILDRYPKLNLVAAETGVGWVPYVLEACDYEWESCKLYEDGFTRKPSDIFRAHCWVDFWYETVGLDYRHLIGINHIMWESDFPHPTNTWPDSDMYIERSLKGIPENEQRMLLVDNARNLYKL